MLNKISWGFVGEGETRSTRKRYDWPVMHIEQKSLLDRKEDSVVINFSRKDSEGVLAHENDPMVIKVHICDWNIEWVFIDPGSSTNVLYWEAFNGDEFRYH